MVRYALHRLVDVYENINPDFALYLRQERERKNEGRANRKGRRR